MVGDSLLQEALSSIHLFSLEWLLFIFHYLISMEVAEMKEDPSYVLESEVISAF